MAQLTEEFVKSRVIEWLGKQNYVIQKTVTLFEHGVDIKAKKSRSNNFFLIECKGEPSADRIKRRYPAFVSALGEIAQRVKYQGHARYAIALPAGYRDLVMRRIPWIAAKKLGLEIMLVSDNGRVDRITWRDLRQRQRQAPICYF